MPVERGERRPQSAESSRSCKTYGGFETPPWSNGPPGLTGCNAGSRWRAPNDSLSGCPKPAFDTVIVNVRQEIIAFAGNDTAVVVGQPLQLNASGGLLYTWTPSQGLNRTDIKNPIAVLSDNMTYILRAYTPEDCEDYDTINIKVFKTNPDIFVPNAFTPGKGHNTVFRPIPVGISNFEFFRIYNRWGQLVYSTNEANKGWDGSIGGKPQDPGTFVWMVRGVAFTGKVIFKKGTMILIR